MVYLPLWKIWVSWHDYSQYMEKQKMFQTTYQMNACGPLLYLSPLNLSQKKIHNINIHHQIYNQWIGLRENLQETIDFPKKYEAFRLKFSLKPIHWYKKSNVTGSSPPKVSTKSCPAESSPQVEPGHTPKFIFGPMVDNSPSSCNKKTTRRWFPPRHKLVN